MSRINAKLQPIHLPDEILSQELHNVLDQFATASEHHTLKRVTHASKRFTAHTNNSRFFFDKIGFMHHRYIVLHEEYLQRFGHRFPLHHEYYGNFGVFKKRFIELYDHWHTTIQETRAFNRLALTHILSESKTQQFNYYGELITTQQFNNLMCMSALVQ